MEALLLLIPTTAARGHPGQGDFTLDAEGRITRGPGTIYAGAQIVQPAGLADIPERAFSLNRLWDSQIATGRAFGILHQGGWCDVGSPKGLAEAEAMLADV